MYTVTKAQQFIEKYTNLPKLHLLSSFAEKLPENLELEMVSIPEGEFTMGTSDKEIEELCRENNTEWFKREARQHQVTISPFHLGKYPITNAQWQAVMNTNPTAKLDKKFQGNNQPVVGVTWQDAIKFCLRLSEMTGKNYRLPSEAEWEYACRAGEETLYHFGDDESQLGVYAWYEQNYQGTTQPVGQKKPNAWGLYDMHGNVWEWCLDEWHKNHLGAPRDGVARFKHRDAQQAIQRVDMKETSLIRYDLELLLTRNHYAQTLRGGSWFEYSWVCRSATRTCFPPDEHFNFYGFRVVC